jgi:1-acyl-sn-glycerol-3-phosphate acyltransferase
MSEIEHIKGERPRGFRKRSHFATFFLRKFFQFLGMIKFVDTTIIGRENIPKKGPAIIGPNHISMIDIIFVWTALRRVVIALGAAELFDNKYIGWLGKLLGFAPVIRKLKDGSNAEEASRSGAKAKEILANVLAWMGIVIMFSEGRCVSPGDSQEFFPGAAVLAFRTGALIVPVYIDGANRVLPLGRDREKGKRRFDLRQKVVLVFGKPLDPKDFNSPEELTAAHQAAVFKLRDRLPLAA